jgi:hypothetical protein
MDDNVRDLDAIAELEYAVDFDNDGGFVRDEVDDAVADDDIDGGVLEQESFGETLAQVDVVGVEDACALTCSPEHGLGRIDGDDAAGGANLGAAISVSKPAPQSVSRAVSPG